MFTLTPDDLYFLRPLRADSQRLYRALVLLWARVERVLLSETTSIPEGVITQVSTQLGLSPALLEQQRNQPSMRSATFEAVRVYLGVRAFQEADEGRLHAYLRKRSHIPAITRPSQCRNGLAGQRRDLTPPRRNDLGALDLPGPQSGGKRAL